MPDEAALCLTDRQATEAGVLAALDCYARYDQPDDTVLLFFALHGEYDAAGQLRFLFHDSKPGGGLTAQELLARLLSSRGLFVVDACYSGTVPEARSVQQGHFHRGCASFEPAPHRGLPISPRGTSSVLVSRPWPFSLSMNSRTRLRAATGFSLKTRSTGRASG